MRSHALASAYSLPLSNNSRWKLKWRHSLVSHAVAVPERETEEDVVPNGRRAVTLLRDYAKCISGQQDEAKRRIHGATRPTDTTD
jgi:hypothetical protein